MADKSAKFLSLKIDLSDCTHLAFYCKSAIKITTTYIRSKIESNRMKYVPKSQNHEHQFTFHTSTSHKSYDMARSIVIHENLCKKIEIASDLRLSVIEMFQPILFYVLSFIPCLAFTRRVFRSKRFKKMLLVSISVYTFSVVPTLIWLLVILALFVT